MEIILSEIRQRLPLTEESRRLFHGRGHCFPGYEDVLIDWFSPVALISLYSHRNEEWLEQLTLMLSNELNSLNTVFVQERFLPNAPVRLLWGTKSPVVNAVEGGLSYRLRLGDAQNIGFFPDMCLGRKLVHNLSAGKKILNLFSYTCSFSVTALSAGAKNVVNVDMNRGALELGRLNHQINELDLRRVSFLSLDILHSFNRLKKLGPFDLVICDPPAYQGKSFKAERDWPKLLRKLAELLTPNADVLACLNGPHLKPDFLTELIQDLRPELLLIDKFQPGADFPENENSRGNWVFYYRNSSATDETVTDEIF